MFIYSLIGEQVQRRADACNGVAKQVYLYPTVQLLVSKLADEHGKQGAFVCSQEVMLQAAREGRLLHRDLRVAGTHDDVPIGIDDHPLPWPFVQEPELAASRYNILPSNFQVSPDKRSRVEPHVEHLAACSGSTRYAWLAMTVWSMHSYGLKQIWWTREQSQHDLGPARCGSQYCHLRPCSANM